MAILLIITYKRINKTFNKVPNMIAEVFTCRVSLAQKLKNFMDILFMLLLIAVDG